jgi:multidrug resistance efflux pump
MRGKWMLMAGITVVVLLLTGGALTWCWFRPCSAPAKTPTTPAQAVSNSSEVTLTGKIEAQQVIPVAAPIEGIVDELFVEPGADVYEGQLLARIRNGKLDSALESATAEVEKLKARVTTLEGSIIAARLEASRAGADATRVKAEYDRLDRAYQRQQMLLKEGATPRLTFEKAEKEFKQIKAEYDSVADVARTADDRVATLNRDLDAAKKLLDGRVQDLENAKEEAGQGEVKSPVDGMVVSRKGVAGEPVSPMMEDFFVLAANLTALQVVVEPDPSVLPRIKPGQIAGIRIAEAGEELPGIVRELRGENQVIVEFVSPGAGVKPGMTAQARISLGGETQPPQQPAAPPVATKK